MDYYENLLPNRKGFLEQLVNLVLTQFKLQKKHNNKSFEELESNPEYMQRIFINGDWGIGKTFFSNALIESFKNKKIKILKINAWESDCFSDPMKSLLGEISLKENFFTKEIIEVGNKLVLNSLKFLFSKLFQNTILTKLNLDKADFEELKAIFSGLNKTGLEEYKTYKNLIEEFKNYLNLDDSEKIIIIDELDRCHPDYAIEILETVKHLFDVKNIIFIFLVNKEQLKYNIYKSYPQNSNIDYFEKFFDIEFELPEVNYSEYFNLQYNKYKYSSAYETDNIHISARKDILFERIFLEVVEANIHYNKCSLREFIKKFKKFKILINSLNYEDTYSLSLVFSLIIYFFYREFNFNLDMKKHLRNIFLNTCCKDFEKEENSHNFPRKISDFDNLSLRAPIFTMNLYSYKFYIILFFALFPSDESVKIDNVKDYKDNKNLQININANENIMFKELISGFRYDQDILFPILEINNKVIPSNNIMPSDIWKWCESKYNFIKNS